MKKSFGDRLEELRGDLSQRDFAKKIGVPLTSYTNWVLGVSQPKFESIYAICSKLGVSADWLLGLSSAPPAPTADAPSGHPEDFWRDLVASQQQTIADLTRLLAVQKNHTAPVRSSGREASKTA
jgi:transcriptional regulator with XRE-family HTH domain